MTQTSPTPEEEQEWRDWVDSRPETVKTVAQRFNPWTLYKLYQTGQIVSISSFSEDGTISVDVLPFPFNMNAASYNVFGVDPDDLRKAYDD